MELKRRSTRWDYSSEECDITFSYVPWERIATADLSQQIYWRERAQIITNSVNNLKSSEYEDDFSNVNLALLVFDSNRMEGTISAKMEEGATMNKIMEYFSSKLPKPSVTPWCSEGGRDLNTPSCDRQLYQNTAAVKYLLLANRFSPLSLELIVETHRLLMENSYNLSDHGRTKVPVEVGTVRTIKEVNAGMYQFTPARAVLNATQYLVSQYNNLSNYNHPIALATYLFYELITIHPFENGNGRLCRLFLAWSLMRDGFPFAVSFSSGHSNRRQHYIHAINTARSSTRGELNVILLLSIDRVLSNYLENMRIMKQAEVVANEGKKEILNSKTKI
jgi:Fic family protein